jgi:RNA polymerase sigma-70 factor (ECF subfamily)
MSNHSLVVALVQHYDDLIDHLRRRFGDAASAQDVVHDVCLRLLSDPPAAEVRMPLAFLRRTATHLAIDRYRVEQARGAWVSSEAEPPDVAGDVPGVERLLDARREIELLACAIETLPPRCREVFVMHKIHEMPQPEVAARLGISRNMVEKHVMRGLAACREALATPHDGGFGA